MDAELAKELVSLMETTLAAARPAKHVVMTKWATALGVVALISGWATFNTVVARWNAIPVVEARTEEATAQIQANRESLAAHKTAYAVEMTKLSMQLDAMEKRQVEQKEQLLDIGRKIDRLAGRPVADPQ